MPPRFAFPENNLMIPQGLNIPTVGGFINLHKSQCNASGRYLKGLKTVAEYGVPSSPIPR